ncbi:MAG: hypothetical protein HOV81_44890 [Kofleriaceae bacterium]|nr:hypothetical protein [Kofleriaceae bacterium]
MRWSSVVGVVVACASPPSGPDRSGQVAISSAPLGVSFGPYTMTFGDDPSLALPVALTTGSGTNLVAPPVTCVQSLAGVLLYPGGRAIGGEPGSSDVEIQLAGPSVARVAIAFEVPYRCAHGPEKLTGRTTYTFFPSGRIDRVDEDIRAGAIPDTGSCTCGAGDASYVYATFWSFRSETDLGPDDTVRTPGSAGARGCTRVDHHLIAVAYGDEAVEAAGGTYTLSWNMGRAPFGDTTPKRSHSAIAIAPADGISCQDLLGRLVDPPLTVGEEIARSEGGIYIDDVMHASAFVITAAAPITAGLALETSLGGARHARVTKGGTATSFTAQAVGDRILFWFAEPLMPGEQIVVEPLF